MHKKMLFILSVFIMLLVSPMQHVMANGLSLSSADGSILKNRSDFHVYTVPSPYWDSLQAAENQFYSQKNEIIVRLYSGKVDGANYVDRSSVNRKPAQYFLEIASENTSVFYKIENIVRVKDIRQVEGLGLIDPIRIQALVMEPRKDGGEQIDGDENNALYQIVLRFKKNDMDDMKSLELDVVKISQLSSKILEIRSVSRYGRLFGRAILHEVYERPSYLEVELYNDPGPGTTPVTVVAQQRIGISSNRLTYDAYSKLFGEESYGGGPKDVEWDGQILRYEIHIRGKQFRCELNKLDQKNFDTTCTSY